MISSLVSGIANCSALIHGADQLLAARRSGAGARTLWLNLLDALAERRDQVSTCGAVADAHLRSVEHG